MAAFLAALDIMLSFGFGYCVRWFNARDLWQRIAGCGAGALTAGWGIAFNLFVAHYRMAMDQEMFMNNPREFNAFPMALETLANSPLGVDQVDALFLFILGMGLSALAAWSGFRWDDPVPGYGALGKRLAEARQEMEAATAPVHEQLDVLYGEFHQKLQDHRNRVTSVVTELEHRIKTKQHLLESVRGYLVQREMAARTLLQMYRDANRRARTDPDTVPAYFQKVYKMDYPDWLDDDRGAEKRHGREQTKRAQRVRAGCDEAERELRSLLMQERHALVVESDYVNGESHTNPA